MKIETARRLINYEGKDVLSIDKATTIDSGGLTITAGGLTVTAGGASITGGLTVSTPFATVTDPGDAGTITPSTNTDFICSITTAGAETRVLGTPNFDGQVGIISFGTDGGNFTMTNASGWLGEADSTVATFDDATDAIVVQATDSAAGTDWRVVAFKGVTFGNKLVAVADPGDGNTIAPPAGGEDFSSSITTAGAETRVLGTPTRIGQKAVVIFDTDGGNFTMTNASGWLDFAASSVVTFDDAGDAVTFEALATGAATDWRAIAPKGVSFGSGVSTIADPGNGGTITPVADQLVNRCDVTTAGAGETRVLGVPSFVGQMLVVEHVTDGGDFDITIAAGHKDGGASDDVASFAEAEDCEVLIACGSTAADWRFVSAAGVAFA